MPIDTHTPAWNSECNNLINNNFLGVRGILYVNATNTSALDNNFYLQMDNGSIICSGGVRNFYLIEIVGNLGTSSISVASNKIVNNTSSGMIWMQASGHISNLWNDGTIEFKGASSYTYTLDVPGSMTCGSTSEIKPMFDCGSTDCSIIHVQNDMALAGTLTPMKTDSTTPPPHASFYFMNCGGNATGGFNASTYVINTRTFTLTVAFVTALDA